MITYSRAVMNVNLDAIVHNLKEMKKRVGDRTGIMAVIKADGYGHGAIPIAKELEDKQFVWGCGVACADEAATLREHGILKPILILGEIFPEQLHFIVNLDLQVTVFDFETAKRLSDTCISLGRDLKIHVKIDTGMSRLGFYVDEEGVNQIEQISKLPHIILEGIFTHFAKADEMDKRFSLKQLVLFDRMCEMLKERGIVFSLKHASNSAGMIDLEDAHFDLVRAGISMYGIWPSDEVRKENLNLIPVMELKSRVVSLKVVKEGEIISYGGTYQVTKDERIAAVSIGYGDGYPRSLSNKGFVLIRGKRAPIRGRVCMDRLMVDVSLIENVKVGDVVTLIGRDGNEMITVLDLSEQSNRFHYEIPCVITQRVKRVYSKNGKIMTSNE